MKVLKYVLLGVTALALVVAAGIAYLVFAFDPRDYQPRIVELVKEKTGRTLQIQGAIKLSFWPDLAMRLGAVSLTERASDERFVEVENARLTLKLVPLLSRELIFDDLLVEGARVRITRFADGRLNIDDLLKGEGEAAQFDVGRVKVARSAVSYRDLGSGSQYEFSGIDLQTGRIANAVATPLELAFTVSDSAGHFDLKTSLAGRLTVDPVQKSYALDKARLDTKGRLAGAMIASARVEGSFSADMKASAFKATQLTAVVRARVDGETIDASLDVPAGAFEGTHAVAEAASASVRTSGAAGTTRIDLKLSRIERKSDTVSAEATVWDFELRRGRRTVQLSAASPVEADLAQRTLHLTGLDAKFSASGTPFPGRGISGVFAGKASFDLAKQGMQTALKGRIDDSTIKAQIKASGFAAPVVAFVVDVDRLDMDRYAAGTPSTKASAGALDLASLSALPATGTLHIGVLKTAGVNARNVTLEVKP